MPQSFLKTTRVAKNAPTSGPAIPVVPRVPRAVSTSLTGRSTSRMGVELKTLCRVRQITVNEDDMATGAIYFDENGVEHHQRAEVVIMACNGVGTPRVAAQFKVKELSGWPGEQVRACRQESDVSSLGHG